MVSYVKLRLDDLFRQTFLAAHCCTLMNVLCARGGGLAVGSGWVRWREANLFGSDTTRHAHARESSDPGGWGGGFSPREWMIWITFDPVRTYILQVCSIYFYYQSSYSWDCYFSSSISWEIKVLTNTACSLHRSSVLSCKSLKQIQIKITN